MRDSLILISLDANELGDLFMYIFKFMYANAVVVFESEIIWNGIFGRFVCILLRDLWKHNLLNEFNLKKLEFSNYVKVISKFENETLALIVHSKCWKINLKTLKCALKIQMTQIIKMKRSIHFIANSPQTVSENVQSKISKHAWEELS